MQSGTAFHLILCFQEQECGMISSPGTEGTVSESGWSNSGIFIDYLKSHFTKYINVQTQKGLLLLDGHKSHVTLPVIEWSQQNNIIL